ncbi:hypothetical protein [Catalinimonas alkaloidigena]|nr:hypothetical protein [Catalinimonas alkaloidigena]
MQKAFTVMSDAAQIVVLGTGAQYGSFNSPNVGSATWTYKGDGKVGIQATVQETMLYSGPNYNKARFEGLRLINFAQTQPSNYRLTMWFVDCEVLKLTGGYWNFLNINNFNEGFYFTNSLVRQVFIGGNILQMVRCTFHRMSWTVVTGNSNSIGYANNTSFRENIYSACLIEINSTTRPIWFNFCHFDEDTFFINTPASADTFNLDGSATGGLIVGQYYRTTANVGIAKPISNIFLYSGEDMTGKSGQVQRAFKSNTVEAQYPNCRTIQCTQGGTADSIFNDANQLDYTLHVNSAARFSSENGGYVGCRQVAHSFTQQGQFTLGPKTTWNGGVELVNQDVASGDDIVTEIRDLGENVPIGAIQCGGDENMYEGQFFDADADLQPLAGLGGVLEKVAYTDAAAVALESGEIYHIVGYASVRLAIDTNAANDRLLTEGQNFSARAGEKIIEVADSVAPQKQIGKVIFKPNIRTIWIRWSMTSPEHLTTRRWYKIELNRIPYWDSVVTDMEDGYNAANQRPIIARFLQMKPVITARFERVRSL